ncbi:MAG: PepSY-associated TM helix domain-containing protein [Pseudomonas sp.]
MKESFRQSMAWLHTWVGLLLGWLLYFMFITGSAGYWDTEIDRWMQPELAVAGQHPPTAETIDAGLQRLAEVAPQASRWFITLARDRNNPYPSIFWQEGGSSAEEQLDPGTAAPPVARATGGGQLLYQMHWRLHYLPRTAADWIVGIASMLMFLALITGVVVHKKIFKDFFTFRPGKGQRSWLDAHNVISVISLPFQLMITYSGLVFMMFIYMPLTVAAFYGTDAESRTLFQQEAFLAPDLPEPSGQPAPLVSTEALLGQVVMLWPEERLSYVDIRHPGDANARIIVSSSNAEGPLRSRDTLVFDGTSGELLGSHPAQGSAGRFSRDLLLGLHEGLFAGVLLRWLYFFSGLLGAAMLASGLVLWAVKRRQRAERRGEDHAGLRLVEGLNIASIAGLPVAVAAYFWANRLLPVGWEGRADWEVHVMFSVWAGLFLHAALRPASRAWIEQLSLAAMAFALLPLLSALTTERHLGHSLLAGDWVFVGFELTMLAVGLAAALSAVYLHRRDQRCRSEPALKQAGVARRQQDRPAELREARP